jgi:hypothetical protein
VHMVVSCPAISGCVSGSYAPEEGRRLT